MPYIVGLHDLRAEINADYRDTPINELCISVKGEIKFLSMRSAFPLDEISWKFDTMFRNYSTELFHIVWKSHMKAASGIAIKTSTTLVIEDIKTKIWDPAFDECKSLLDSVHDRSIKLVDVDRYFRHIDKRDMLLHRLHNGVMECLGVVRHKINLEWIHTAVNLMMEYWSLVNLADAARTLMTLKNKLNLSGDFSLIRTIAEEVSAEVRVS